MKAVRFACLAAFASAAVSATTAFAGANDHIIDVVSPWEIGSADAAKSGHVFRWMGISETLVGVKPNGDLIPMLATKWSLDDSHKVWTFTIREGVKFHNGKPVTAEAVAHSLNVAMSKPGVLAKSPVKTIAAKGNTIVVTLKEPYSTLPSIFTHASTQILAAESYEKSGNIVNVIATGPFKLSLLETPQRLEAVRYDNYWGHKAYADGVTYLAAPRSETRNLMIQSGDADVAFNMDKASLKRLEMMADVYGVSERGPRIITLKLNCKRDGLDTARGRRAINAAIDRVGIARTILRDPKSVSNQMFSPMFGDWYLKGEPAFKYDPSFTKSEFKAMGWKEDGDGYLAKDGKRLSFVLTTYSDRPELPVIATSMQESMRQAGIEIKVSVNNSSAIPAGHHDGSLDMGMTARNFGVVRDPFVVVEADFGNGGGDWGAMNWPSKEMDSYIQQLKVSDGSEKYQKIMQKAAHLMQDQMPVLSVAWYIQTAVVSNKLKNFKLDPFQLTWNMGEAKWAE